MCSEKDSRSQNLNLTTWEKDVIPPTITRCTIAPLHRRWRHILMHDLCMSNQRLACMHHNFYSGLCCAFMSQVSVYFFTYNVIRLNAHTHHHHHIGLLNLYTHICNLHLPPSSYFHHHHHTSTFHVLSISASNSESHKLGTTIKTLTTTLSWVKSKRILT